MLRLLADARRTTLGQSEVGSGCLVRAAATATDPRPREVAREVFEDRQRLSTGALAASGVPRLSRAGP